MVRGFSSRVFNLSLNSHCAFQRENARVVLLMNKKRGLLADDRAQLSLEYIVMVAVVLILATVLLLLVSNIFSLKEGLKSNINAFRSRVLQTI